MNHGHQKWKSTSKDGKPSDFLEGITDMRTRKVIDEENDDQWLDHITERAKAALELARTKP